jgi:predicted nucleotidyltransferase
MNTPRFLPVLQALAALPYADRLIVFGSIAKGTTHEFSDVDVFLDCTEKGIKESGLLLKLCKQFYGQLDVFIDTVHSGLLVRDEEATSWTMAERSTSLRRAAKKDGKPLKEILEKYAVEV